jgi:hypothetical protein
MTEHRLKVILAYLVLVIDFGLLALVSICLGLGWFNRDEATTMLGILLPSAPGHTAVVWRFIVDTRLIKKMVSGQVSTAFVISSLCLLGLPTFFNTVIILRQASGGFHFADSKLMLVAVESFFSGFVGYLIGKLYSRLE